MKPENNPVSKRQTRATTKKIEQSRKRKGQESSDSGSAKGKTRKKKEKEATDDEKKMGNFLSKWLFGSKQETEEEIERRERLNARAEEEAKWEKEEKRRILRAKALKSAPSDTEDDEVDRMTLTLIQQRERDEERASRQREHYDIRKQRLAFHEEGRLHLSVFEVDKLKVLIKCRQNDKGEWDYTLLPEFRHHYDRLVLKNQHDGDQLIATRREMFEEETRRRHEFKEQALATDDVTDVTNAATNDVMNNATNDVTTEAAVNQQTIVSTTDVQAEIHSDSSCSQDSEHMRALTDSNVNNSVTNGYSNSVGMEDETVPSTSAAGRDTGAYAHSMSPSPRSNATDDTIDIESGDYNQEADTLVPKKKKKMSGKERREMEHKRQKIERKKKLKLISNWSMEDTREYRQGYPGKLEIPDIVENKEFYFNKRVSQPEGGTIEEILEDWKGDYTRLERHHGYIQWLFPIREKGMNFQSYELQPHEARDILADKVAKGRVVRAYKMMLDFYGMQLMDERTGEVGRADREDHWLNRAQHLNKSFHNYLRITRILKCLGELGYEHYKVPFIEFMLVEAIERETLPNCARSCMEYWLYTIRDDGERKRLKEKAHRLIDESTSHAEARL